MVRFVFITFGLMGLSVAGGFALSTTHSGLTESEVATRGQAPERAPLLSDHAPARVVVQQAEDRVELGVLTPLPSQMERVVPTAVTASTFPAHETIVGEEAETARVVVPTSSGSIGTAQVDSMFTPTVTPKLTRGAPALAARPAIRAPQPRIARGASPVPEYLIGVYR